MINAHFRRKDCIQADANVTGTSVIKHVRKKEQGQTAHRSEARRKEDI